MERANHDWSDSAPTDILRSILSRLVAGDYFAFRAVCKRWRFIEPLPPPLPVQDYDHYINSPCLMSLKDSGVLEVFHPLYNTLTHTMDFPELKHCRIRCSKANWLLMSLGDNVMFFFNPISKMKIELPPLPGEAAIHYLSVWTFSCPPDSSSSSSSCFVVGLSMFGSPPPVCIIEVGESGWTVHPFFSGDGDICNKRTFMLPGCNNPIFFRNNIVYIIGDKGDKGVLRINKNSPPTWKFYEKPLFSPEKQSEIEQVWTAQDVDNGGMLCVFLGHEEGAIEVWRYTFNKLEPKQITDLGNKTLFVGRGGCFLKPCVGRGLRNKVYVPMFHEEDNNKKKKGVFYSLASNGYYSFDYSINKAFSSQNYLNFVHPMSCIWFEPEA